MGLDKNTKIFDDIAFSDIAREIWQKKKTKDEQIKILIEELKPFVKNIGDAAILVPLLKEYMEIAVKNDEILVKLAGIIQKLIVADSKEEGSDEFGLSAAERKQLLQEAGNLSDQLTQIKPEDISVKPVESDKKEVTSGK